MRHLDEVEALLGATEGAENAVDAVARVAVDPVDAPLGQAVEHVIADGGHLLPPSRCAPLLQQARYFFFDAC